jgi:putative exporter of polyketide antibiotics
MDSGLIRENPGWGTGAFTTLSGALMHVFAVIEHAHQLESAGIGRLHPCASCGRAA